MATVNLFFSRMNSMRYVFPNGQEAAFIGGRFVTSDEYQIAHLNDEIKKGHPHIYLDADNISCEEADLDPMEVLRKKIIAEYLASQEANKTESTSEAQPLTPASTVTLEGKSAEVAAIEALTVDTPAPDANVTSGVAGIDLGALLAK